MGGDGGLDACVCVYRMWGTKNAHRILVQNPLGGLRSWFSHHSVSYI
jgi:hypothetical protein